MLQHSGKLYNCDADDNYTILNTISKAQLLGNHNIGGATEVSNMSD